VESLIGLLSDCDSEAHNGWAIGRGGGPGALAHQGPDLVDPLLGQMAILLLVALRRSRWHLGRRSSPRKEDPCAASALVDLCCSHILHGVPIGVRPARCSRNNDGGASPLAVPALSSMASTTASASRISSVGGPIARLPSPR